MRGFLAIAVLLLGLYGVGFLQAEEAGSRIVELKAEKEYFMSSQLEDALKGAQQSRVKW